MYQGDLSFIIVAILQRNHLNFLLIISKLPCRIFGLTLVTQETIDKINRIKNVPKDATLITADVIRFSHYILHAAGLKTLRNPLDARENKSILTKKLLWTADFSIKNSAFNFNVSMKKHVWDTAIGTKCVLSYSSIIMSKFETNFIGSQ